MKFYGKMGEHPEKGERCEDRIKKYFKKKKRILSGFEKTTGTSGFLKIASINEGMNSHANHILQFFF